MTTISNNDLNSSSLNIGYVEIEKLLSQSAGESTSRKQAESQTESNSKKSFVSNNDLVQLKKLANNNKKENDRLKQMLRNGNWSPVHPIRKNLWTSLLELNNKDLPSSNETSKDSPNVNKKKFISNESEYIHYLNQIFGTCEP